MNEGGSTADRSEFGAEVLRHKKRLMSIWRERPAATDTADVISRKWLGQLDTKSVIEALRRLMDEGLVQKWCSGGHTFFFARDPKAIKRTQE